MRKSVVFLSLAAIILLSSLIPEVHADTIVYITETFDEAIEPVMFGNSTAYPHEDTTRISVTDDGIIFMLGYCYLWELVRGETPVSLIAWDSDGNIMWSHTWGCFRLQLFGMTIDETYVYVAGRERGDIFVGKFDYFGQQIWNKSIDLGESETGWTIGILDDGTIIIGGYQYSEPEPDQTLTEGILVALDLDGNYSWHATYEVDTNILCDSNSIYINSLNTIQRLDNRGDIVWFVDSMDSQLLNVRDEMLYTYRGYTTNYTWTSISGSTFEGPFAQTDVDILSWNTETGHPLNLNNIKFCDYNGQTYNRTVIQSIVAKDGSLGMLIGCYDIEKWYLSSIIPTTELTSTTLLLNGTWHNVLLDMDDTGNVYLAATSRTYGLTVMRFDSSQLASGPSSASDVISPPIDLSSDGMIDVQIVTLTLIGVTFIDVTFIVYLKRRVAR
ncbi:MAG: hypothetical protein ACFFF9_12420 [Candidatus Thorarchaeota archaeon]